ncbi:DUF2892 domain-containing protein [bacterium]|nr:DUF2892 domain-containing protein [bacterium]NUN44619.1 DUF2892 domain-containing protein [bacterium]HMV26529.1 DUF2892 domain-containing protein [bacterium]HMW32675.1 DUF2892 domain-containing protein [bacterium]HMW37434.1 DUF2892 domain-containing protein [bacterium]
MTKNMGNADRALRIIAAIAIIALYYGGMLSGWLTTVLLIVAVAFIVTSFISWCPLYLPFGINTRKKE